MAESLPFEDVELAERAIGEPTLHVDVDGFEGPLDLLLELARRQKVDLHRISILALAEQYLVFIEEARKLRLELAADYLVMAAWLAYLKSRLLLPEARERRRALGAADLATALALRLRRLEAIREAAKRMEERAQLGRDVFARGAPEPIADPQGGRLGGDALRPALGLCPPASEADDEPRRHAEAACLVARRGARGAASGLLGQAQDWTVLDSYLVRYIACARAAADGSRLGVLGEPRARPRGPSRDAPGRAPSRRSGCAA